MPLIRCTRKLVAEIGTQVASPAGQVEAAMLGDCYANLLQIGRRKCVIFTSERTLLTFVVMPLNRDAIRDYATLFRRGLQQVLESEGFAPGDGDGRERPLEEFGKLLSTYEGWGMRIEFTPDDATERRPRLEVREPDEP
jgi:hypothetical protein